MSYTDASPHIVCHNCHVCDWCGAGAMELRCGETSGLKVQEVPVFVQDTGSWL